MAQLTADLRREVGIMYMLLPAFVYVAAVVVALRRRVGAVAAE